MMSYLKKKGKCLNSNSLVHRNVRFRKMATIRSRKILNLDQLAKFWESAVVGSCDWAMLLERRLLMCALLGPPQGDGPEMAIG